MYKLLTVIFLIRWVPLLAYKYELEFQNSDIFSACNEFPDNFLDKYLTMPDNLTFLPDGNIYVNGDVVLTYDFKAPVKYPFKAEFFKRDRGEWVKTLYTIRREDLCTSFFNPSEIWHSFVKDIPDNQRSCPYQKGQTFNIDLIMDTQVEVSASDCEGDYRGRLEVGTNKPPDNVFFCAEVYFSAYRV